MQRHVAQGYRRVGVYLDEDDIRAGDAKQQEVKEAEELVEDLDGCIDPEPDPSPAYPIEGTKVMEMDTGILYHLRVGSGLDVPVHGTFKTIPKHCIGILPSCREELQT